MFSSLMMFRAEVRSIWIFFIAKGLGRGEPKYVFLMLFTITMDFFIGKGIDKAKKEGNQKKAKRFLMTSILVDLSILGFFKYADFLIGTVNTLTGAGIPLLGIPLPIGISFFTFQTNVIHD